MTLAEAHIEVVCPGMLDVLSVGKKRRRRLHTDVERFRSHIVIDPGTGCWSWSGYVGSKGYGQFRVRERLWKAHRWAFEHWRGPVPAGLDLDHECHNRDRSCRGGAGCVHRRCVNPWHLEPATRKQNLSAGRGSTPPIRCKLTADEVRLIRRRYAAGGVSTLRLAGEYGVAPSAIHNVVTGKSWKQAGGPVVAVGARP